MSGNGKKSLQEEYDEAQEALVQAAARLKEASRPKNATRAQVERAAYQDHSELEAELKKARYIRDAKLREFNAQNVATLDPRQELVNAVDTAQKVYDEAEGAMRVYEEEEARLTREKAQGKHVPLESIEHVAQMALQKSIPLRKASKMLERAEDELFRYDHHEELEVERKRQEYVNLRTVGMIEAQARKAEIERRAMERARRLGQQEVDKIDMRWKNLAEEIAREQSPAILEEQDAKAEAILANDGLLAYIKHKTMDQEQ